jgi:hypothetical protein
MAALTPIDSNWSSAEAPKSSFAEAWDLIVWVRLPHASAKVPLNLWSLRCGKAKNLPQCPSSNRPTGLGTRLRKR